MVLALDIGNTHIVIGVFRGDTLVGTWRLPSDPALDAVQYCSELDALLQSADIASVEIDGAVVASVVPPLLPTLLEAASQLCDCQPFVVDTDADIGLGIAYNDPVQLGPDRIVNAVAAFHCVNGAVIVVDLGTATTFDCVSTRGMYLGGAIAPGVRVSAEALVQAGARLPSVQLKVPERVIGRNTAECMQAGIVIGYACMVEGMVARLQAELGAGAAVIATGGLAGLIAPLCPCVGRIEPDLTLRGLKILFDRNRKNGYKSPQKAGFPGRE